MRITRFLFSFYDIIFNMEKKSWLHPRFRNMPKWKIALYIASVIVVALAMMIAFLFFMIYGVINDNFNMVWVAFFCMIFVVNCGVVFFAYISFYKENKKQFHIALLLSTVALIALIADIVFWYYGIRTGVRVAKPIHSISIIAVCIMIYKANSSKGKTSEPPNNDAPQE